MKRKIGIITFHAAHNYGSSLQSYALQRVIAGMDLPCEIINLRTEAQKDQYRPLTKRKGLKYVLKNAYFLLNYKSRKVKYDIFEDFISRVLVKSPLEYESLEQLEAAELDYTHYISGSDQIWNTVPNDANMAYFLPFVKAGKRIAYAPSFGQIGNIRCKDEIRKYLNRYDFLSVREEAGAELVQELTGKRAPVLVDPTMLLEKKEWEKLIAPDRIIQGDYIFFYTLFADPGMIQIVKKVSHVLGVPVVISNVSNQYEIFSGFRKHTQTGPLEFLNLIQNAKFVCTSSFHGTVFSILFHKPFLAIRGATDKRISNLLSVTSLENHSVMTEEEITDNRISVLINSEFSASDIAIQQERQRAMKFLETALGE